jgi:hypothetical protein
MTYAVGAQGFIGIEAESTPGTYIAPTIFLPLLEESLSFNQVQIQRRPLRGIADMSGMLPSDQSVTGSMKVEITHDTLPAILRCARCTGVKTGAGPFTYTFTPNALAVPAKTMSITVVRHTTAGIFGFTGCVVSSMKFAMEDGILTGEFGIVGRGEATQSLPTPTYVTTAPPATGQFDLKFAGVSSTDADSFELNIDDKAEPQFRMQGGGVRTAVFVKYGEREITAAINRDFQDRTDFDAYKAMTAQAIDLNCVQTATSAEVNFNVPTAIKDTYAIEGLKGQGDLVRANISYQGVYDTVTSRAYQIVCKSAATLTIP